LQPSFEALLQQQVSALFKSILCIIIVLGNTGGARLELERSIFPSGGKTLYIWRNNENIIYKNRNF
jgi:hypothetical protein